MNPFGSSMFTAEEDELERRARLVHQVWEDCWDEFHDWKAVYCKQQLQSLKRTGRPSVKSEDVEVVSDSRATSVPTVSNFPANRAFEREDSVVEGRNEDHSYKSLTVWHFGTSGSRSEVKPTSLSVPTFPCDPTLEKMEPVAPYESCMPIMKSIHISNSSAEREVLDFIPFADEPSFQEEHSEFVYDRDGRPKWFFAWEHPGRDPDIDVVLSEAVRRLSIEHGLSHADIDSTRVLPKDLIVGDEPWDPSKTRALLPWPSEADRHRPPDTNGVNNPKVFSMAQSLEHWSNYMCMSLSCITPLCQTHNIFPAQPAPKNTRPTISELIKACSGSPCDVNCFVLYRTDTIPDGLWSAEDMQDLETMLDVHDASSKLSICRLAKMLAKPCWEVYVHAILSPGPFKFEASPKNSPKRSRTTWKDLSNQMKGKRGSEGDGWKDVEYKEYQSTPHCTHDGPCDARSNCVCFKARHHCKRNCPCPVTCPRRFPGCSCPPREGACAETKCRCFRWGRECNPELCSKCGSEAGYPCRNANMLHRRKKLTRVVLGKYSWGYGWGCQAAERVKKGEVIDEYVGEIIQGSENNVRTEMADYLRRNYIFSLDSERLVDSARAANETRFINHGSDDEINCHSEMIYSSDDWRIVLKASRDIEPGEELLFDYGAEYFGDKGLRPSHK